MTNVYINNRLTNYSADGIGELLTEIIDSYEGVLNDGYVGYAGQYIVFCIPTFANSWSDNLNYYLYKDTGSKRQNALINKKWREFEEIKAYYESEDN